EVPKVTHFGLADAMNAAEALLKSIRIPRQVVVDHQVGAALQVHAFARRVISDEDAYPRIVIERRDVGLAHIARDPALDHCHRFMLADPLTDVARQVFERIAWFSEDQQLSPLPGDLVDDRGLVEDFSELTPFSILTGFA